MLYWCQGSSKVIVMDVQYILCEHTQSQRYCHRHYCAKQDTMFVHRLIMNVYGWFGSYGTRHNSGKEDTQELSNSVNYVSYDSVEQDSIASAVSAAAAQADIEIVVGDLPASSPTTEEPTSPAEPVLMLVGIASGSAVAILLLILLIVVISVFGRRRKPK